MPKILNKIKPFGYSVLIRAFAVRLGRELKPLKSKVLLGSYLSVFRGSLGVQPRKGGELSNKKPPKRSLVSYLNLITTPSVALCVASETVLLAVANRPLL